MLVYIKRNGHCADKTLKEFHQLFKENRLYLEIECNLKTVHYLDITVDLNTGTCKAYHKPKPYIKHFISSLNPISINPLPISIKTRLSNLFSNPEIFHEASKQYQSILDQSGYDCKLQFKPPNNENENKHKSL